MTQAGVLALDIVPNFAGFAEKLKTGTRGAAAAAEGELKLSKTSKAIQDIGLGVAAVGVGIAAVSVRMATDFQSSMTSLVTGAGESESAIKGVGKGLLDMAGQVGFSADALAKGMFMVESAGYHGAAGLAVMKTAAEGAKVGNADLGATANALTTIMTDYHLKVGQSTTAMNVLIGTVARGKTHMEDLANSVAKVLPFSSSLGISLNDVMGAMATMTARGIDAATAATYLKFTMMSLANETPKGAKALLEVGLNSKIVADVLTKQGLLPALSLVTEAIGKKFPAGSAEYIAALAKIVGGTRGMGAALALTGQNLATYQRNVAELGKEAATTSSVVEGFNKVQKDTQFQVDATKAQAGSLAIELGTSLLPAFNSLVGIARPVLGFFSALPKPIQEATLGLTILGGVSLAVGTRLLAMRASVMLAAAAQASAAVTANAEAAAQTRVSVTAAAAARAEAAQAVAADASAAGSAAAASAGTAFSSTLSRLGVVAGVVTVAFVGMNIAGEQINKWAGETTKSGKDAAKTLTQVAAAGKFTDANIRSLGGSSKSLATVIGDVLNPSVKELLGHFGQTINPVSLLGGRALDASTQALKNMDAGLTSLVATGHADQAAKAFGIIADQANRQGVSLDKLTTQFPLYSTAVATAQTPTQKMAAAQQELATQAAAAQQEMSNMISTMTTWDKGFVNAQTASINVRDAMRQLEAQLKSGKGAFTGTSQAADDAKTKAIAFADAINKDAANMIAAHDPAQKIVDLYNSQRTALEKTLEKFGVGRAAAKKYADQLLSIPPDVLTQLKIQATAELSVHLKASIAGWQAILASSTTGNLLRTTPKTPAATTPPNPFTGKALGPAGGGMLVGAGSSTSDSIPFNGSNGEIVLNAHTVQRVGANKLLRLNAGQNPSIGSGHTFNTTIQTMSPDQVEPMLHQMIRKADALYPVG